MQVVVRILYLSDAGSAVGSINRFSIGFMHAKKSAMNLGSWRA